MKPGLSALMMLIVLLLLAASLVSLAQFYGGVILPASAAEWCRQGLIERHQSYLTALTAFSEKSRSKLLREAQRRLNRDLAGCYGS